MAGTLLITQANPARAALSFTLVILSTCGLFLLLAAPFLMAATIIIYAGAIVVTFLFVLMLAQQIGLSDADFRSREPLFAAIAGFLFLGTMLYVLDGGYSPKRLDLILSRIRQAQELSSAADIQAAVGGKDRPDLIVQLRETLQNLGLKKYSDEILNNGIDTSWPTVADGNEKKMKELLGKALAIGKEAQVQARLGQVVPDVEPPGPEDGPGDGEAQGAGLQVRSPYSGPPATTPVQQLRRDPQTGVPQLPAENSTYLGRSLFTDYLLPVELGGFLLLVAVVGAIAIAQRTSGQERTS